jgi:hypothetical protein
LYPGAWKQVSSGASAIASIQQTGADQKFFAFSTADEITIWGVTIQVINQFFLVIY